MRSGRVLTAEYDRACAQMILIVVVSRLWALVVSGSSGHLGLSVMTFRSGLYSLRGRVPRPARPETGK